MEGRGGISVLCHPSQGTPDKVPGSGNASLRMGVWWCRQQPSLAASWQSNLDPTDPTRATSEGVQLHPVSPYMQYRKWNIVKSQAGQQYSTLHILQTQSTYSPLPENQPGAAKHSFAGEAKPRQLVQKNSKMNGLSWPTQAMSLNDKDSTHHRNTWPLPKHNAAFSAFLSFGVVTELAESPKSSTPCKPLESPVSVSVREWSLCTGSHLLLGWDEAEDLATELWPPLDNSHQSQHLKGARTHWHCSRTVCDALPAGGKLEAQSQKDGDVVRTWWQELTQRKGLATLWQKNSERERTEAKTRQEECKNMVQELGCIGSQKQVQSGRNLTKRQCPIPTQRKFSIVLAGSEGSRLQPSTCSTIPSHKHQQDLLQLPTYSLYCEMLTTGF